MAIDALAEPVAFSASGSGEWRRGWKIVLAAMLGVGLTYSLFLLSAGVFIIPMQAEFGWTRSELALGPMVMLVSGLLNPVAGLLITRFGARRIALIGLLLLASAYLLLAMMPATHGYFYAVAVYLAAAGAMTNVIAYSRGVASWFRRHLVAAIGLTMSGLITAVAVPILSSIIAGHGWRVGYFTLAGLALVAMPFLLLWFRENPDVVAENAPIEAVPVPAASIPQIFRNPQFWILAAAMHLTALGIGGFISQLAPILVSQKLSAGEVAALVSLFTMSIGIGRIGAGWLLDLAARPTMVASLCIAAPALGALLLSISGLSGYHWAIAAAGVALIGLAQGAEADFTAFFLIRLFGLKVYGILYGSMLAGISLCMAAGGLFYAASFDRLGDYHLIIYGSVATFILSACLILTLRIPKRPRPT